MTLSAFPFIRRNRARDDLFAIATALAGIAMLALALILGD